MSRSIIVDKDFKVEGFGKPLETTPTLMTSAEAVVLNSPTGKYPRPLEDNPRPPADAKALAELIHRIRFPKPQA